MGESDGKHDFEFAVAPSRIHRRGVPTGTADFHHRHLNGFSSAATSDSRSQLSASSPDSLDASSSCRNPRGGQSNDDDGGSGNSGRSSRNYYYRDGCPFTKVTISEMQKKVSTVSSQ